MALDLTGMQIANWLVLSEAGYRKIGKTKKKQWLCQCQCAKKTERTVLQEDLREVMNHPEDRTRGSRSCGCSRLGNEPSNKSHGHRRKKGKATQTYRSWLGAQQRCTNPKTRQWPLYGGRSPNPVTMCQRWVNSFANFLEDMGERPEKHSIDRIDGTKGYWCGKAECPECGPSGRSPNCRWADSLTQGRNKDNYPQWEYRGQMLYLHELAALPVAAVKSTLISNRLRRGWPVEEAVERPKGVRLAVTTTGTPTEGVNGASR